VKTYQALARAFIRENVETCFALLGDANMHWAGALSELGTRFVYTRHEHAAVAGAAAYARASSKVGCATVTCGPGLTQIMTILPIVVRARLPLIIFVGEAPVRKEWYNQGIDHAPFVEACGAEYVALHQPDTMLEGIHHAFTKAKRDSVPIVIGVPFDLQQDVWNGADDHPISETLMEPLPLLVPEETAIAEAASWFAEAKRPILLAGLGAVGARSACIHLAQSTGTLLATTLPAKGLFHDQEFCLGVAGGYATERSRTIFSEADLVLAVGARLAAHTFDGGKLTPHARVIHLDTVPQQRVQGREASDLMIKSDAQLGLTALMKAAPKQLGWRSDAMKMQTSEALELAKDNIAPDGFHHPMTVIQRLAESIPHDVHVINTSGHSAYYTAQMNNHPQSHYTVIRDFGAIGNGTSFALGVSAANPERPIVLIDGDGSALMNIQELETFDRHNMKVLVIVLNDGAYGSEVHKLRADGVTLAGSVFGRSDFASIGRGFGLVGHTIENLDQLPDRMAEFLAVEGPAIWDIPVSDQIASPQILKAYKAAHH